MSPVEMPSEKDGEIYNDAVKVDEQKSWGREGYPVASIDRSGRTVGVTTKGGRGQLFPFREVDEAIACYSALATLGDTMFKVTKDLAERADAWLKLTEDGGAFNADHYHTEHDELEESIFGVNVLVDKTMPVDQVKIASNKESKTIENLCACNCLCTSKQRSEGHAVDCNEVYRTKCKLDGHGVSKVPPGGPVTDKEREERKRGRNERYQ